jgi:hypothetical protein
MVNALVVNSRLLVNLLAFPLVQACTSLWQVSWCSKLLPVSPYLVITSRVVFGSSLSINSSSVLSQPPTHLCQRCFPTACFITTISVTSLRCLVFHCSHILLVIYRCFARSLSLCFRVVSLPSLFVSISLRLPTGWHQEHSQSTIVLLGWWLFLCRYHWPLDVVSWLMRVRRLSESLTLRTFGH